MSRAIDADALEKEGWSLHRTIRVDKNTEEYQTKPLRKVSTIEPQQRWIPCSERLPKYEEEVIVSVRDDSGDTTFDYSSCGWYACAGDFWIVDNEPNYYVIAWMPLPEPYAERRTDGV